MPTSFKEDRDPYLKNLFLLGILSIIFTFLFSFLAYSLFSNRYPKGLENWARWDTNLYLQIAKDGYTLEGKESFNIVFLPLYPLLISFLSAFSLDPLFSALLISNFCFLALILFFYKLIKEDFNREKALLGVFYLLSFPTAYFLHAGYTESLFLLFVVLSFLSARKKDWLSASFWGMLASLTRMVGLVLFPVYLIEYLFEKGFSLKELKNGMLRLSLIPLAFLAYLLINYSLFEDPWHFSFAYEEGWGKVVASPHLGLINALKGHFWHPPAVALMGGAMEIVFVIFAAFVILLSFSKLPRIYSFFATFSLLFITSNTFWQSLPRYTLSIFPIFIALPLIIKSPLWRFAILYCFLLFQGFFLGLYANGYWAF